MSEATFPEDYLPENLDKVVEGLMEFVNEETGLNSQKWRRMLTLRGEEYYRPDEPLVPESYQGPVSPSQRRDHIEYNDFSLDITYEKKEGGFKVEYMTRGKGHVETDLSEVEEKVKEYLSTVSFK